MYEKREHMCAVLACMYYAVLVICYFCMGILYTHGFRYLSLFSWALSVLAVSIVFYTDHNFKAPGFYGEKTKANLIIACIIAAVCSVIGFCFSPLPASKVLYGIAYYLFYIALQEEVIFRGFLQSYLFGFHWKKQWLFVLGAAMFSLMHIPFQMFVYGLVSPAYLLVCWPQLIFTFCFHLAMCWLTYWRKDILLPTVLHFAIDFLQSVL